MHSNTWHVPAVEPVCTVERGALRRIKDTLWARGSCRLGFAPRGNGPVPQNVPKPWRETTHLCNPKASPQRFSMAGAVCGGERECLWPALIAGQRARWVRPEEAEASSQPGPAHVNPSFMNPTLCITHAGLESSFIFCLSSPWSFHSFLSLVTQSSEMGRKMNNKCLLARFFYFSVRLVLWPSNHHSELPPLDQITRCLWFHMKGCLSSLWLPNAVNLPWKGLRLRARQFRTGRINMKPLDYFST